MEPLKTTAVRRQWPGLINNYI